MVELSGKLANLQIDFRTRQPLITFLVDQDVSGIEELADERLNIKVGKYKQKRSLDSNAYFHVLVDKLAQKLNIPRSEMKNQLISDYGQVMYLDDGVPFIYKTNAPPEVIHKQEVVHMWLLKIGNDGAYWYKGYQPTHLYNTEEMSLLIKGTIEECRAQGIETATPDELARMNQLWKEKYERSTQARQNISE